MGTLLAPVRAIEKRSPFSGLLTSDSYPSSEFEAAEVGQFKCTAENRAPCSKSSPTECGRANPRCDASLFAGKITGPWIPCCEKRNLYELLVFFHNTVRPHIDIHGKGFWYSLVFGSAIGSLRGADLIDWDTDIDIVAPEGQMQWLVEVLQDAAKKATPPYVLTQDKYTHGYPVTRLHLSGNNTAHIDIWQAKNIDPDHPQKCVSIGSCKYPSAVSFPLQKCRLQGSSFPCFAEGSKYIEYEYGSQWKEPGTSKGGVGNPCQEATTGALAELAIDHSGAIMRRATGASVSSGAESVEVVDGPVTPQMHPLAANNLDSKTQGFSHNAVATALLIPLLIAGWLAHKSGRGVNWSAPFSYTSYELMLVGVYMTLSPLSSLAIRQTHGSALNLTVEACLLLYVVKASISLVCLIVKRSMSFSEIANILKQKEAGMFLPVWCNLALVGALFATYDTFSFAAFQHLPPLSSQLLLNCRVIFLVPLQWRVIGKKVSLVQFFALLLIAFAACSLGVSDISAFNLTSDLKSQQAYLIGVGLIFGKIILSGFGLVINELMLKELPLTVDAQNFITYCFSMVFLSVGMCTRSFYGSSAAEKDVEMVWGQIFHNQWMICAVMLMAALGIMCAYLLKAFSAMEKEFMAQGVVALLAIGQALTPGEHGLTLPSIESGLIIVLSCVAYRLNEPPAETTSTNK